MKTKMLLLIGAIALVIVGCVIAAGCTSTETTATDDASTDAIVGVWFSDSDNVKSTKIILADGTGYSFASNANGTIWVYQFGWKKNADGTYAMKWTDEFETTWTPNSAKDTMASSSGKTNVKKSFGEAAKNILGVWYNKDRGASYVFNADGTGFGIWENDRLLTFTWKSKGSDKIELAFTGGTLSDGTDAKGKVIEWTYDGDNNVIISSFGTKYIRPTESVAGITLTTFSTEPIVGQWTKKYQKDGKTVDAVMTLRNDGTGNWMALGDVEGMQITSYYKNTWKKTGENTYQVTTNGSTYDGNSYEFVYDSATDALTANGKIAYTRLDPIVGIWYSTLSGEKSNTASHLFKPDGTGVATVAYDDGTAMVNKLTWKKNSDGTYAIAYIGRDVPVNANTSTYIIDAAGNTITTSSGATKSKLLYRDMTSLMSIIGAWYNKDNDVSYVFNADGTGFGFWENGSVLPFIWKLKGIGNYEVTYTGGTWSDGTSAKGKVTEWTYDGDNNVFISSVGIKYIRPSESVKDKITLY